MDQNKFADPKNNYIYTEYAKAYGLDFEILTRENTLSICCKKLEIYFSKQIDESLYDSIIRASQHGSIPTLEFVDDKYTSIRYSIVSCNGETISVVSESDVGYKPIDIYNLNYLGELLHALLIDEIKKNQALRIALYMKDFKN